MVVVLLVVGLCRATASSVQAEDQDIALWGSRPFCLVNEVHCLAVQGQLAALKHFHLRCGELLLVLAP